MHDSLQLVLNLLYLFEWGGKEKNLEFRIIVWLGLGGGGRGEERKKNNKSFVRGRGPGGAGRGGEISEGDLICGCVCVVCRGMKLKYRVEAKLATPKKNPPVCVPFWKRRRKKRKKIFFPLD